MKPSDQKSTAAIVFFDGVCGLCNRFVDFLIRHDQAKHLRFSPLQGDTARRLFVSPIGVDTIICSVGGVSYKRSTAALRALAMLGGWHQLWKLLLMIPRPIRDLAYDKIADNRFQWYGRLDSCRIPKPEERDRFLP